MLRYDKNEPNWGEDLKKRIKKAIQEVLQAPQEAVLPSFLMIKESDKEKSISAHDREIVGIRQDIDYLKRELRNGNIEPTKKYRHSIDPQEAADLIKDLLRRKAPQGYIIKRLAREGVPRDWV